MNQITLKTPSFEFAGIWPLVTATVEGVSGNYLIDNGVPTLVLNSRYDHAQSMPAQAFSASGELQDIKTRLVSHFEFEDLRLGNQMALVMDLSHFEKETNTIIHGIIGASVLFSRDLLLNYSKKQVGALELDPPGLLESLARVLIGEYHTIPFQMANHLPVIPIRIGEKKLNMALYMGLAVNTINLAHKEYVQQSGLLSGAAPATIMGLSTVKNVTAYSMLSSVVGMGGDVPLGSMKFAFDDISMPGANIDGMLGYEFFAQRVSIARFNRRELVC